MYMKRRDIYWVAAYGLLAAATVLLCVTGGFAWFNATYPYLAGFIQFSVYATAGELLSGRMLEGHWQINRATWFKSVSWGVGGLFVTLAFSVFSQGTQQAMAAGLLPGYGNALALAFFTSCTNNLFFCPHPLRPDAGVWKLWRDPLSGGTPYYAAPGSGLGGLGRAGGFYPV